MNDLFDKLNLKPEERRLAVLFMAVAFVFVNYMYVFPRFKELNETKSQIQVAENTFASYRLKTNSIPDLQLKLEDLGREAGPPIEDTPGQRTSFVRTVNRMASKHQINLKTQGQIREVLPPPGQTNSFFTELEIPIIVTSTEEQMVNFLYSLGNEESLIRVRSLTLSPSREGGLMLDGNISLVASYLKSQPKGKGPQKETN